jgi:hypothetical protein
MFLVETSASEARRLRKFYILLCLIIILLGGSPLGALFLTTRFYVKRRPPAHGFRLLGFRLGSSGNDEPKALPARVVPQLMRPPGPTMSDEEYKPKAQRGRYGNRFGQF